MTASLFDGVRLKEVFEWQLLILDLAPATMIYVKDVQIVQL
jgi:hypothetical protein